MLELIARLALGLLVAPIVIGLLIAMLYFNLKDYITGNKDDWWDSGK